MKLRYHIRDILNAYRKGLFPMAEDAEADHFFFYEPEKRGLLPIQSFHIPKRLARTVRKQPFKVTINTAFTDVIDGCAEATDDRPKTWINQSIRDIFIILHQARYAHSVECWDEDGTLVGGLYGLALGGVFFGESMFSRKTDASKIALVHLMARLWAGGFVLCDIQFINEHLTQFGAYEIPQSEYLGLLNRAMGGEARFSRLGLGHVYANECELVTAYIKYVRERT